MEACRSAPATGTLAAVLMRRRCGQSRVTSAAEACRVQRRNKEQDCNYNAVRSTFYRQTAAWLERACASYSLKLKDGSEYEWKLPHLEILLQEAADTSPCLQSLLLRLPDGHPAQEALFFCDACTPGNVLAPDRQRKTVGLLPELFRFWEMLGQPCGLVLHRMPAAQHRAATPRRDL